MCFSCGLAVHDRNSVTRLVDYDTHRQHARRRITWTVSCLHCSRKGLPRDPVLQHEGSTFCLFVIQSAPCFFFPSSSFSLFFPTSSFSFLFLPPQTGWVVGLGDFADIAVVRNSAAEPLGGGSPLSIAFTITSESHAPVLAPPPPFKANAAEIKTKYGIVLSTGLSKKLGAVKVGLYCSVAMIIIAAIAGAIASRKSSRAAAAVSVSLLAAAAIATFASVGSFGKHLPSAHRSFVLPAIHWWPILHLLCLARLLWFVIDPLGML